MKCPICNEADHASGAVFCHMCGSRLGKTNKRLCIGIVILAVIVVIAGIIIHSNNDYSLNTVSPSSVPAESYYEQRIMATVQSLCEATVNNDFGKLSELYAYYVKRYHSLYDVSNGEVIERCKNYDNKFGVYAKRANIRWNTLQIWRFADGYSVVYVEDYHIDRADKSKYSNFVLEKHLELDENFRIVSEYNVQLSKY